MEKIDWTQLTEIAKEIRRDVIKMTYLAGNQGAHMGGSLSLCEIMAVLYGGVMKIDPSNRLNSKRDRLILSKGHGAIAMYAGLKQAGILTDAELKSYKQDGSYITAHPSYMPEKGMEFASGSLGQGLSIGAGVCLAWKIKGNKISRAFVVMGDGECDEGSVWEAAAFASHYALNNLVCMIDKNDLQYDGATKDILNMESMILKWRAFGWKTKEIDGHDVTEIYDALTEQTDQPLCVICRTVKGKGVSFAENDYRWHNARLSESQYRKALEEVVQ